MMMVMVFLKHMLDRDANKSHFNDGGTHAINMAIKVGELLDRKKTGVYYCL